MQKKIMILGAGVFQLPAIHKAREMGLVTVVCGGNADEPGLKIADVPCHVSTTDMEGVLAVARRESIDGVMTIASEISVSTVTFVAEKLGLPGYRHETARNIMNKFRLREILAAHDIPVPAFGIARRAGESREIAERVGFPVILKPVESSGSRGVSVLQSADGIEAAWRRGADLSQGERSVVIERYIAGREVGGECIVRNRKLAFMEITNKYINRWHVPLGHSAPSTLDRGDIAATEELVSRCIEVFDIDEGPLNLDVMITADGPVVLELGARLGGNCLPRIMELGTGVDTEKAAIAMALGDPPALDRSRRDCVGVRILGSETDGVLGRGADAGLFHEHLESDIIEAVIDLKPGEPIKKFDQGSHRFGHVILRGSSIECLERDFTTIDRICSEWVLDMP